MRKGAAKALGQIGDVRAVEPLIAALKDNNEDVREDVAKALGQIGDVVAGEPLCAALKDNEEKVRRAARQLFGGDRSGFSESIPSYLMDTVELEKGVPAFLLFEKSGLCNSRGEARRLIAQGGGYVNDKRIGSFDQMISSKDIVNGSILLKAGKKRYIRVTMH